MPTINLIDDGDVRHIVGELTADAPDYFWEVPASTSGFHHPACRNERGLWAHTLMLSTVIDRLADSYTGQGRLTEYDIDLAHAAAILHDQRKNGDPLNPSPKSTSDHDLQMAEVVLESDLDDAVADAIASHMGAWYDGPYPSNDLEDLVHTADMVASTASITPKVQGPIPEELEHCGLEATDLR
ncbi:HDIG domain-containing metalloprotein [Natronosalvus caseinilyticus]|uniref:HDIG domain-containing metalloprotein n=1 Tax=Natronosalvus caseinilyticus TaxID=2953747 RepID=UPI0028AF6B28|nr:HDIG domain-containing metalloprotein [Natronosalvus caseinilyticus]